MDKSIHVMKPLMALRYVGGNLIGDLDEDEYVKGIENLKFSVVGWIYVKREASLPTTMNLKSKLGEVWGIQRFKLVQWGVAIIM